MTNAVLIEEKTKDFNVELQTRIRSMIDRDGMSQNSVAKKLDISPTALSQYLNSKYNGDISALENSITKLLDLNVQQKKYGKIALDFVQTTVANKVSNIAQICQLNGEIALCTGLSGLGKTTAIKNYAKKHSGVIVIDPDEQINVRALMHYFCKPLRLEQGINESNVSFAEKIVNKLNRSGKLIIVDESENLDVSCFRALRKIHDRCNATVGLLFVGTDALANKLSKLGGEYDYLFTRFSYIDNLDTLTINDTSLLVNQIFPNCGDSLIELFHATARANARVLFNLLKRTRDIVTSSGEELNASIIKSASGFVGASLKNVR